MATTLISTSLLLVSGHTMDAKDLMTALHNPTLDSTHRRCMMLYQLDFMRILRLKDRT
jgi:hypothetical protein